MKSRNLNLPDVDFSAPDVYEYSGPSADTAETQFTEQLDVSSNPDILQTEQSMKAAAARFKDSLVDTESTDFLQSIIAHKQRAYRSMTRAHPTDLPESVLESNGQAPALLETPVQKLKRLLYEASELEQELTAADSSTSTSQQNAADPKLLLEHVKSLQKQLQRLDVSHGDSAKEVLPVYDTELNGKILEQLLNATAAQQTKPAANAESADGVKYELFYTNQLQKTAEQERLCSISERLAALENIVGIQDISDKNVRLVDLVKKLERQLSVLADPLIVEAAFKKCAQLKSEIDSMPQQQQISIDSKRVSELYSVMEKAEEMMDIVPLLLDRFSSLQSVHQELASFAETAQTVGREQTVVADTIKTTSQTLERIEKSIKESDKVIAANLQVLRHE